MDGTAVVRWAWQVGGSAVLLLVIVDIFLTVLYARVGTGVLSRLLARGMWRGFRFAARVLLSGRGRVLSFAGPVIVVVVVVVWIVLLTLGAAMVIYPNLGGAVKSNTGPTPVQFVTAIYAGGNSLSIGGSSEFAPQTQGMRLFYLFNVFLGMSTITLILTYLMEIYGALQRRNTLAVKMTLTAGDGPDAAEWLARAGARGKFETGYGTIMEAAAEVTNIKESHHFYPVLFYFRFRDPCYAAPRFAMMALDAMALARSALDGERYGWLQESAGVLLLGTAARQFVEMLAREFLPGRKEAAPEPTQEERARWRRRYFAAVERFKAAGIATAADENAGAERYVALRREWDHAIVRLAGYMAYAMSDIDPFYPRAAGKERRGGEGARAARVAGHS